MKKLLFLVTVLIFHCGFSQCVIAGPDQIQVGESSQYSLENADENCTNCYNWSYQDQKILLEGDTTRSKITIKGAVPGTAVLSSTVSSGKNKTQCEKSISVIPPKTDVLSPEVNCDFSPVNIKEIRVSDSVVAFEPETKEDYSYLWTITYRSGQKKTSTEKSPKFDYSNNLVIDQVEMDLTWNKCSKKITKTYDRNFWYFF